jgi:hypothetical protein
MKTESGSTRYISLCGELALEEAVDLSVNHRGMMAMILTG